MSDGLLIGLYSIGKSISATDDNDIVELNRRSASRLPGAS